MKQEYYNPVKFESEIGRRRSNSFPIKTTDELGGRHDAAARPKPIRSLQQRSQNSIDLQAIYASHVLHLIVSIRLWRAAVRWRRAGNGESMTRDCIFSYF